MTSTKQLIDTFKSQLPSCYVELALSIEAQLRAGALYSNLGGKKIRSCPNYIRFKLGRGFRFVWRVAPDELYPKAITTRQGFERIIKQIRKTSY